MADEMRIVLLGKTGHGKSSSGNTILGDSSSTKFVINGSPNSVTSMCEELTGPRPGTETQIKIIDTPGLFDTRSSDEELKREMVKCIVTCAPGPHAFIIVLRVERYTEQEAATVAKITASFGEDAFKYSVVLFTDGDRLDNETIGQFVEQSKELKELVGKCGGRCHVIDNRHWNQEHEYRSNRVQVEKLLNTIDEMVRKNGGDCYTNEMLQAVEKGIQALLPMFKSRAEVMHIFMVNFLVQCTGLTTRELIGALLGVVVVVAAACTMPIVALAGAVGGVVLGIQAVKNEDAIKKAKI